MSFLPRGITRKIFMLCKKTLGISHRRQAVVRVGVIDKSISVLCVQCNCCETSYYHLSIDEP